MSSELTDFEDGYRTAIDELAGGYEYGAGPDWRAWGVEWLRGALPAILADRTDRAEAAARNITFTAASDQGDRNG